ncbi:MAG TPA: HDIG domain-containing protein [Candidatus Obscuribacter sp.]|nr:HDIG domain-containing protein [Candidatus Obscuribacter sp.]
MSSKKAVQFLPGRHPLDNPAVQTVFQNAGHLPLHLVGGCLRDNIDVPANSSAPSRNIKPTTDFDFAVGGDALAFAGEMARVLKGHFVVLDESFDIARVVLDDGSYLDFAGYKGSLEVDIRRRDLTINALVMEPGSPDRVIDLVGGLHDLEKNLVRAVSEESLLEDPLRLLRVYRFAVARAATIEGATRSYLGKAENLARLSQVARERVNYELFTLLNYDGVGKYIHDMGESGLLEALFPELRDCRRVTSNSFHHLALFDHSLETIPQLEAKMPSLPDYIHLSANREVVHGVTRLAVAKLSALLHDIGKPDTWVIQPDGRHSFIAHDKVGAAMVRPLGEREKWPRNISRLVEKLVLWHLRPGQLFHTGEPTQKALNRFYRNAGEDFPELMLITFADFGATMGPGLSGEKRENLEKSFHRLLNEYPTYMEQVRALPRLLSGEDVMKLLEVGPGPLVGEILQAVNEAQEIKEVTNRAQAEALARSIYDAKK